VQISKIAPSAIHFWGSEPKYINKEGQGSKRKAGWICDTLYVHVMCALYLPSKFIHALEFGTMHCPHYAQFLQLYIINWSSISPLHVLNDSLRLVKPLVPFTLGYLPPFCHRKKASPSSPLSFITLAWYYCEMSIFHFLQSLFKCPGSFKVHTIVTLTAKKHAYANTFILYN